ncbi:MULTISPECIES: calcium-binding protein [unclassified Streptomyces]|uniref:calcium-binding protein n=1 Tax=unclassified Streptomyces TaxID=2593676 RepID=UPI0033B18656
MSSSQAGRRSLRVSSALTLLLGAGMASSLLGGTAAAATPAAPATAATATVASDGRAIVYNAAPGQTNDVTVTATITDDSSRITYLIDDSVPIGAGTDCAYPSATDRTKVACTVGTLESQDPYPALRMSLGDGDDVVAYANATDQAYYFASLDLGAGRDAYTETGDVSGNGVSGGAGDDHLTVGEVTVVWGDAGDDTLRGGAGSIAKGGDGDDTIRSSGEDSHADGGAGGDTLLGGAGRQHLSGDDGDDLIRGGAGDDFVYGGRGHDILHGEDGDDTMYGNSGNDELYGGRGTDTLSGGPGRNVVHQD